ncbi:hypothetical protein QBC43DRAFT_310823 [Cladorrhinum sp. PSN259]|nr:hypothetical protein QBC43DRAFT_310823 [Cladorrhinum sp. PSN259]
MFVISFLEDLLFVYVLFSWMEYGHGMAWQTGGIYLPIDLFWVMRKSSYSLRHHHQWEIVLFVFLGIRQLVDLGG